MGCCGYREGRAIRDGSRRSQGREMALLNREVDSPLGQLPPYQERLAQPRVEVVLEHRRARVQQVAIGKSFQLGGPHARQLFAGGSVLNEPRSVGDAQLTEGESAMAAVVEDQTVLGVDDGEEIGIAAHPQS